MVLALAALAAAAASFPTGFGFGAGYGAGVRIGYDVIYPKLAPFASKITDDIIAQVSNLFGSDAGIPAESSSKSGFKFAVDPKQTFTEKPEKTIIPTGRTRDIAASCDTSHKRWTAIQRRVVTLSRTVASQKRNLSTNQSKRGSQFSLQMLNISKRELTKLSAELDNALNNPNNQNCVSTWDPKAAF